MRTNVHLRCQNKDQPSSETGQHVKSICNNTLEFTTHLILLDYNLPNNSADKFFHILSSDNTRDKVGFASPSTPF